MTAMGDAGPGAVDALTAQQEVEKFARYRYNIDPDKPKAWRRIDDLLRCPLHGIAAYFVPCSPPQVIDPIRRTWAPEKLPSQQLQLLDFLQRIVARLKGCEERADRLTAELAAARAELGAAIMRERATTALNGRAIRALLMCASHCQGGHSDAGSAVADLLDVPFPLTMEALAAKAKALGYDQDDLWPWYGPMLAARTVGGSDAG